MLHQLLGGSMASIVGQLTSQLGVSADQANAFIGKALPMIEGLLKGGGLDPSQLLKGDLSGLASKLDLGSLSQAFGGDVGKAKNGVDVLGEGIADAIGRNSGGIEQLLGQLGGQSGGGGGGGLAGAVGSLGKLFGKG